MSKEGPGVLSCIQEPCCCQRRYLLPGWVMLFDRSVERVAVGPAPRCKRGVAKICDQLQAAGFGKWPPDAQSIGTENLKCRMPGRNIFDERNDFRAPALQYISIKLQPITMGLSL